jgi:hypothetical protein
MQQRFEVAEVLSPVEQRVSDQGDPVAFFQFERKRGCDSWNGAGDRSRLCIDAVLLKFWIKCRFRFAG